MVYPEEQLMEALRSADASGDTESAGRIAGIIKAQRNQQQSRPPAEQDYSRDELMNALRAADSAGDDAAAQHIAGMIKSLPQPSPSFREGLEQTGKGLLQTAVNVANIPSVIGDAVYDADAWLSGKLQGKKVQPSRMPRFELPESMRPTDPYAKLGSEILSYLIPAIGPERAAAALASVANAGRTERYATKAADMLAENLPGALAQNSGSNQHEFGEDLALGVAGSAAGRVVGSGIRALRSGANAALESAQPAVNQTEEAMRRLASQRKPDPASSLDGLSVNPQQDVAEAAGRLGVESVLPSHLSGNAQYQAVEQAIKSRPGSALKVQEDKAISELASGAGRIIDDIAGAPDALAMSDRFIGQVNGRMSALEHRSDQLYERVDNAMSPGTRVDAKNTATMLEKEADDLGGWENLDGIELKVFKAVNPGPGGTLTYANLNKQRRLVGDALHKNSGPYKDADRAALSRLYGSLADDQKAALSGTDSLRDFEVAQRLVQMRKTMENQMINLRGKTLNGDVTYKATTALQSLSKGNAKGFRELMDNTPSRNLRTELIGTALRDMLSSGKRGADFNPAGFADWWQNMQTGGQIRTLSQHLPKETMAGLQDVYKVARAIKNAKSYEITTGRLNEFIDRFNRVTATHEMAARHAQKIGTMVGSYGGLIGAIAGSEIGQRIAARARMAGGAGSADAADRLISSPEFQRAVKSLPAKVPEHVMDSRVRKSPQWRNFFDSLPEEDKRTIARLGIVTWLMQSKDEH